MELRELVRELVFISVIHRCRITKSASSVGLYFGQPMILEYVKNNDKCSQKELAGAVRISPASAAISLKRIEKAGFLTRMSDETDPRKKLLSITSKGEKALLEFHKICDATDKEMFKGFSDGEKETLHSLLLRLHENLDSKSYTREEIEKLLNESKLKREDE